MPSFEVEMLVETEWLPVVHKVPPTLGAFRMLVHKRSGGGDAITVDEPKLSSRRTPSLRWNASKLDLTWLSPGDAQGVPSQAVLVQTISGVRKLIRAEAYEVVRTALNTAASDKGPAPEILIAALRAANTARRKIPHWKSIVARARERLSGLNLDADKLLKGL